MATQPDGRLTPAAYLALERKAETKSEYLDGTLVAMSGATREHILITSNLVRVLGNQLLDRTCEVYPQNMRVRITEGGMYAYPDVVVVCGEPQFEDDEFDVLLNPTVIVEVLSPTTEAYDRGLKFARYRMRQSLQDYALIAQDRLSVERFSRRNDEWTFVAATRLDDVIDLPSIGCTLTLRDIYQRIQFPLATQAPNPPDDGLPATLPSLNDGQTGSPSSGP